MNKIEKKIKKRIDNNLNKLVKNPYIKPKKQFPVWGRILIPLGSAMAACTVALAIILPLTLQASSGMKAGDNAYDYSGNPTAPAQDSAPNQGEALENLSNIDGEYQSTVCYELRTPAGLSHAFTYEEVNKPTYLDFKNKMNEFSRKISEYFVETKFQNHTNIVCSPVSIELCLGLAIRSASGNTRDELLAAFGVDFNTFNQYYKTYFNELTRNIKDDNGVPMTVTNLTNSIWINESTPLLKSGLDDLRDDYYCYSFYGDFVNHNSEVNEEISRFLRKNTNNLLNPELNFDVNTLFVLMNTLYLKDIWSTTTDNLEYAPASYVFKNSNGNNSTKRMLDGNYSLGKALIKEKYSSFMARTSGGFALHFIKPNDGVTIEEVFNKENISFITDMNNYTKRNDEKEEEYYTKCIFPEFTAEFNDNIRDILESKFNIKEFFSESCDLSNLIDETNNKQQFLISDVKHITKLEVNRVGIEGAAATIIPVPGKGPEKEYKKVLEEFVVDKQFGLVLTFNNAIMFSGIVSYAN